MYSPVSRLTSPNVVAARYEVAMNPMPFQSVAPLARARSRLRIRARRECRRLRRSHHPAQLGVGADIVHWDVAGALLEAGEPAT